MVARQRRSAEYWKKVIEDFLKSGMLQKNYAQEHKICRATLSAWSRRLGLPLSDRRRYPKPKAEEAPSLAMSFIDIEPLGRAKMSSSLKIEISFPQGHTLKLETDGTWEEAGSFIRALVG